MNNTSKMMLAMAAMVFAVGAKPASPAAGDVATLRLEKGYDQGVKLGAATIQKYRMLKQGSCTKSTTLARITWTNGPFKEKIVPAGKPQRFEVTTTQHRYNSYGFCTSLFSFTPKAGQRYSVIHKATVGVSCRIDVTDLNTGTPPEDLQRFDLAECQRRL